MTDVDHKLFEKKIIVRQLQLSDYPALVAMQQRCFPGMKPWSREQIASQLQRFPEGQIAIEIDGRLAASSSSLVIDFDEYDEGHTWHEVADHGYIRNHNPEGDTLYGIEVMVDPEFRGTKLARRLYEARKRLCVDRNLKRIVIGGRIPGFVDHKDKLSARQYVEKVSAGSLYDPVLTTQIANGFVLKRLIHSYLDSDTASDGHATLLEWVNLDYRPDPHKRYLSSRPARLCVVQYEMRYIQSFDEFSQQCEYFVDVASGYKSDFVLFPEIFTNQMLSFLDAKQPAAAVRKLAEMTPLYLELMSRLAVQYNVNIVGGSHFTLEGDKLYNIAYLFKRNGEIGKQYKLHITPNERRVWGVHRGDSLEIFETDKGKISIQICYDIEFPELSRLAAERGARIVFVPFCTDERHGYLRVRYCAQARCIENQIYVAIAGTVGNLPKAENMDIQYAQSAILTPSDFPFSRDAVAAECTPNVETVVIHDVDLDLLERNRKKGTVLTWQDRRTDLYEVAWKK
ncbi:MAG: GNAT family N-acetyltransferase [Thermoanaerobaculia bacterium]|nr:GNAT family N-acetyltransferase [Thermoanaerobaculia bacterium]